jgi:uncharacterized membrane protein
MQMLKDKWANFRANTMAFFKPEGVWNRQAIIAILIGGFVGWLIITVTFGMRLKKLLKKVPGINMLFKTTRQARRRVGEAAYKTRARVARRVRRK